MALLETKIIQVSNSPEVINSSNDERGSFGWSVQNVQVTHSQDTKTYTKTAWDMYSGDQTVETTTINYATITYQRDKKMPNYARIAELEREYDALADKVGNVYAEGEPSMTLKECLYWFIIWPVCLFFIIRWVIEKKKIADGAEDRKQRINQMINRREAIRSEAENLLD